MKLSAKLGTFLISIAVGPSIAFADFKCVSAKWVSHNHSPLHCDLKISLDNAVTKICTHDLDLPSVATQKNCENFCLESQSGDSKQQSLLQEILFRASQQLEVLHRAIDLLIERKGQLEKHLLRISEETWVNPQVPRQKPSCEAHEE